METFQRFCDENKDLPDYWYEAVKIYKETHPYHYNFYKFLGAQNLDIIKYIFENENIKPDDICNIFQHACGGGKLDVVKYLIEVQKIDHRENGAIVFACRYKHLDVIRYLVKEISADIHMPFKNHYKMGHGAIFEEAVWHRKYEVVEFILFETDSINCSKDICGRDHGSDERDPIKYLFADKEAHDLRLDFIIWACENNRIQFLEFFYKNKFVDIHSILRIGSDHGQVELVKYFVDNYENGNVHVYNNEILCAGIYKNQINIVKYVINDITKENNHITSYMLKKALHVATNFDRIDMIEWLNAIDSKHIKIVEEVEEELKQNTIERDYKLLKEKVERNKTTYATAFKLKEEGWF